MSDGDSSVPKGSADSIDSQVAKPRLTLVVLARPTNSDWATVCRQLKTAIPADEVLFVPIGDACGERATGRPTLPDGCHVQPVAPNYASALRGAMAIATGELIGLVSLPFAATNAPWDDLLELAAKDVVVIESNQASAGGINRLCEATEFLLASLFYGPSTAVSRSALVIARRAVWLASDAAFDEPSAPAGWIAHAVERGAAIVRRRSQSAHPEPVGAPLRFLDHGRGIADLVRGWWRTRQFPSCGAPPDRFTTSSWRYLLTLLLITAAMVLPNLHAPFLEPDEGRHAEIAREMWITGDWLAPQFQGEPYLDKPPMLYWLCAASYSLFGPEDWAARLVPACAGMLTVCGLYLLGRRLTGDRPAFVGAMILALSFGFVACARFLILESVLTMYVVNSLLLGASASQADRWNWSWWIASAAACGLGLLTKGPVALVLVVPPLAMHHWLACSGGPSFWKRWLVYGAVALGLATPWFLSVLLLRPEFFEYFFWRHNLDRFLSGTNHPHSVFFYIPVVLIGVIPWISLFLRTVRFLFVRDGWSESLRTRELGFLTIWVVWCLGFFSAAAGKLPYYILSSFPPLALLMGYFLDRVVMLWAPDPAVRAPAINRLRRSVWLLLGAGIGVAPVMLLMGVISSTAALVMTALWLTAAGIHVRLSIATSPWRHWAFVCLLSALSIAQVTQYGLMGWQAKHAILPDDAALLERMRQPQTQIVCVGAAWGSVPFYLKRDDVVIVDAVELAELESRFDARRQVMLLVEYKLPLQSVQAVLSKGVTCEAVGRSRRVTFAEVRRSVPALSDGGQTSSSATRMSR